MTLPPSPDPAPLPDEAADDIRLLTAGLDAAVTGIVFADLRLADQPLVYVNRAFLDITGYSRDEVIGRNCRFLQGDDVTQPGLDELRDAVRTVRPVTVTLRNYRKDGSPFWNELRLAPMRDRDGRATHMIGVQHDVTARVEAERALHAQNGRLEAVFSLSPDGFAGLDAERRITFANPAFAALTGLDTGQLVGLDLDGLQARLRDARGALGTFADGEAMLRDALHASEAPLLELGGDEPRVLQLRARAADGADASWVLYVRDVSLEHELDRIKTRFLEVAAHELRGPMTSILGYIELLLDRGTGGDRGREALSVVHGQSVRMARLLDALLDLSRLDEHGEIELHPAAIRVREAVDDVIRAIVPVAGGRAIRVEDPSRVGNYVVRADPERLAQALSELLSNALRYSTPGTPVTVRIQPGSGSARDRIGLCVIDQGPGLTPDEREHVFDRFWRAPAAAHRAGLGLGLGLARVQQLQRLQEGDIEFQSSPDEGTRATLWFRLAGSHAPRPTTAATVAPRVRAD